MKTIGVYEAKTHLPSLLDEVEGGETVVITRHGKPVARLMPMAAPKRGMDEIIEGLARIRKASETGPESMKDLINEGRRI